VRRSCSVCGAIRTCPSIQSCGLRIGSELGWNSRFVQTFLLSGVTGGHKILEMFPHGFTGLLFYAGIFSESGEPLDVRLFAEPGHLAFGVAPCIPLRLDQRLRGREFAAQ